MNYQIHLKTPGTWTTTHDVRQAIFQAAAQSYQELHDGSYRSCTGALRRSAASCLEDFYIRITGNPNLYTLENAVERISGLCPQYTSLSEALRVWLPAQTPGKEHQFTLDEPTCTGSAISGTMTRKRCANCGAYKGEIPYCDSPSVVPAKPLQAQIAPDYLPLRTVGKTPDGTSCLSVDCPDFDAFKALPVALAYGDVLHGKTGWNSDIGIAYYQSNAILAKVTSPSSGADSSE